MPGAAPNPAALRMRRLRRRRDRGVILMAKIEVSEATVGVLLGAPIAMVLVNNVRGGSLLSLLLFGVGPGLGMIILMGLAACVSPTVRALRISPTEALRGSG